MVTAFAVAALSSAPKTPVGTPALQQGSAEPCSARFVPQILRRFQFLAVLRCRKSEERGLCYIPCASPGRSTRSR